MSITLTDCSTSNGMRVTATELARRLSVALLFATLTCTAYGAGWTGTLKGGGQVAVDPVTNRATVTREGVQSQLWDGVHRLDDGSYIIVNSGQVIPNKGILDARRQPQDSEIEGWEGGLIKDYSPCERLVHRVCGFTLACADRPACEPALQLLEMENSERAASANPDLMTYTSDQCQQADSDSGFFSSCPQRQDARPPHVRQP